MTPEPAPDSTPDVPASLAPAHGSAHDALIVAFIQGAKWWEYLKTGFTMWERDQHEAEREAQRRAKKGTLGRDALKQWAAAEESEAPESQTGPRSSAERLLAAVRSRLQMALNKAEWSKGNGREAGVVVQNLWSDVKRVVEQIDSETAANVRVSDAMEGGK